MGFQLVVAGFLLPPLMVGGGQLAGPGAVNPAGVEDGGEQDDQLAGAAVEILWLPGPVMPWRRTPQDDDVLRMLRQRRREPNPKTMEFLESMQAALPQQSVRSSPQVTSEALRGIFPGVGKADIAGLSEYISDIQAAARPPTKYEDPLLHMLVQVYAILLDEVVARHGPWAKLINPPLFALMDTGHVNARTIRVPNTGDHIVLVDQELLQFLFLFSDTVALAMPVNKNSAGNFTYSTDPEDIRARLCRDPKLVLWFAEAVLAYASSYTDAILHTFSSKPDHLPDSARLFADIIRQGSIIFVLAHEYVHVLERHLSDGRTVAKADGDTVNQSLWSLAEEGIADRVGLDLTISIMRNSGYDYAMTCWGAELFLYANEIVLDAKNIQRTGKESPMHGGDLHQRAIFNGRRTLLDVRHLDLQKRYGATEELKQHWENVTKSRNVVRVVMTELWNKMKPHIRKM